MPDARDLGAAWADLSAGTSRYRKAVRSGHSAAEKAAYGPAYLDGAAADGFRGAERVLELDVASEVGKERLVEDARTVHTFPLPHLLPKDEPHPGIDDALRIGEEADCRAPLLLRKPLR